MLLIQIKIKKVGNKMSEKKLNGTVIVSVIEVGSFGTDGKNTVSSNRARTVNSYKVSEKTFKFESSKAAGMRYAVVGFDANGKRVLDSGWQTGATYTLGKEVVS